MLGDKKLRKIPRKVLKNSLSLKKEFEHRENGQKELRTSDLYSRPVVRKKQTDNQSLKPADFLVTGAKFLARA